MIKDGSFKIRRNPLNRKFRQYLDRTDALKFEASKESKASSSGTRKMDKNQFHNLQESMRAQEIDQEWVEQGLDLEHWGDQDLEGVDALMDQDDQEDVDEQEIAMSQDDAKSIHTEKTMKTTNTKLPPYLLRKQGKSAEEQQKDTNTTKKGSIEQKMDGVKGLQVGQEEEALEKVKAMLSMLQKTVVGMQTEQQGPYVFDLWGCGFWLGCRHCVWMFQCIVLQWKSRGSQLQLSGFR